MLADLWPEVRRKHLWPELPMPQMGTIEAPVAMQMRDKQITLNTATCDELAESMPPEAVIEALLDHGVSHYTRCPWDLGHASAALRHCQSRIGAEVVGPSRHR